MGKFIQQGVGMLSGEPEVNPDKFRSQAGYTFSSTAPTYYSIYPVSRFVNNIATVILVIFNALL